MAKSKNKGAMNNNTTFKVYRASWDSVAIVFAVIVIMLELVFLFAKPTVSLFGTTVAVTSGFVAFAGVTGAMFWAIVEVMTPPRKHRLDIFLRFFGSFIVGFFIGGFLGFYFKFGQLVLVPSYSGNPFALFEVFAIFVAVVILVSNAAWAHNKGFIDKRKKVAAAR